MSYSQLQLFSRAAEYDRLQAIWLQLEVATNPHKAKAAQRRRLWDTLERMLRTLKVEAGVQPVGLQIKDLAALGPFEYTEVDRDTWEEKKRKRAEARRKMNELRARRLGHSGDSQHPIR